MTVAKIFGAFLMTLILGMSFGAIDTAEAGDPGRKTFKPGTRSLAFAETC